MDYLWYGALACFALSVFCYGMYLWLGYRDRRRDLTRLDALRFYQGVPLRRRVS